VVLSYSFIFDDVSMLLVTGSNH